MEQASKYGENLFDLSNKVVFITGGNRGIGLGMAKAFAGAGARVMIAARDGEKSRLAVEAIREQGGTADAVVTDITSQPSCREAFAATVAQFGTVNVLVNNAGISIRKLPQDYTLEEWHAVLDTNLTGSFICAQLAHPLMKEAGGGKIINIGSMMSIFGTPLSSPYAASKGGVVQLTRALATAWAVDGIQVNAILPGFIETELTGGLLSQFKGLREQVVGRTPAARWGQPDDLIGTAMYLASAASAFVTGTAIPVDGGYSVKA